jgi:hypothetical protein
LNMGVLFRIGNPNKTLSFYILGSTGPHSISENSVRQAKGFVFSNQFSIGLHIRVGKNSYLDLRPRLRHLSNFSREKPNRGINNLIISGGMLVNL